MGEVSYDTVLVVGVKFSDMTEAEDERDWFHLPARQKEEIMAKLYKDEEGGDDPAIRNDLVLATTRRKRKRLQKSTLIEEEPTSVKVFSLKFIAILGFKFI